MLYHEIIEERQTLPMDTESRMTRAKEMGFTINAYHGTTSDFPAFALKHVGKAVTEVPKVRALFFTSSPHEADTYANWQFFRPVWQKTRQGWQFKPPPKTGVGQNIMPVKLKIENPLITDFNDPQHISWNVRHYYAAAHKGGHDGWIWQHVGEHDSTVYAVMRPNQVRSVFAAFDPARANSSNLLA